MLINGVHVHFASHYIIHVKLNWKYLIFGCVGDGFFWELFKRAAQYEIWKLKMYSSNVNTKFKDLQITWAPTGTRLQMIGFTIDVVSTIFSKFCQKTGKDSFLYYVN